MMHDGMKSNEDFFIYIFFIRSIVLTIFFSIDLFIYFAGSVNSFEVQQQSCGSNRFGYGATLVRSRRKIVGFLP